MNALKYAHAMHTFVQAPRRIIRRRGGWFDKFTGDGFIAFWLETAPGGPMHPGHETGQLFSPAIFEDVVPNIHKLLTPRITEVFKENSDRFPPDFGLKIGLDAGSAVLAEVAGEMTILGPPVVGAVRMVDAIEDPGTTLCNVTIGRELYEAQAQGRYVDSDLEVEKVTVKTKESPEGQVAYKLTYGDEKWGPSAYTPTAPG